MQEFVNGDAAKSHVTPEPDEARDLLLIGIHPARMNSESLGHFSWCQERGIVGSGG